MSEFIEGVPTVTVQLDKPRELAFTLGALRRAREKLGDFDLDVDKLESLAALPALLWACLSAEGRKQITVEQIEDMIHPGNMDVISEAVRKLFRKSQPEGPGNPTDAAPAEPAAAS